MAKRYIKRYYIRPQNLFCSNKAEILEKLVKEVGENNCSIYSLKSLADHDDVHLLKPSDIIYYYDNGILYDKNHVKVMDYDLNVKHEEDRKKFGDVDTVSDETFDKEYEDRLTEAIKKLPGDNESEFNREWATELNNRIRVNRSTNVNDAPVVKLRFRRYYGAEPEITSVLVNQVEFINGTIAFLAREFSKKIVDKYEFRIYLDDLFRNYQVSPKLTGCSREKIDKYESYIGITWVSPWFSDLLGEMALAKSIRMQEITAFNRTADATAARSWESLSTKERVVARDWFKANIDKIVLEVPSGEPILPDYQVDNSEVYTDVINHFQDEQLRCIEKFDLNCNTKLDATESTKPLTLGTNITLKYRIPKSEEPAKWYLENWHNRYYVTFTTSKLSEVPKVVQSLLSGCRCTFEKTIQNNAVVMTILNQAFDNDLDFLASSTNTIHATSTADNVSMFDDNPFNQEFDSVNAYGELVTVNEAIEAKFTCCICGEESEGYGNNPAPIKESGKCCDACNRKFVIPARLGFEVED